MVTHRKTLFTTEDANRTLPLVRSIVGDVADKWQELVQARTEYGNSSPAHDRILRELADYIQELKKIGCHLQDFEKGIVQFPAELGGKDVLLSWQLGEERVDHLLEETTRRAKRVTIAEFAGKE